MKSLSIVLLILFIADFIFDIIIAGSESSTIRYLSKGMLMPLLLVFFISEVKAYTNKYNLRHVKFISLALVFSFIGDMFLIEESSVNFMLGIGFFLIAQCFYIAFFLSIRSLKNINVVLLSITSIIILAYLIVLNFLFWPVVSREHFIIPVIAYSIVLGLMLLCSVNLINLKQQRNAAMFNFIPGAIIFVASDSIIALNSFYLQKPLPGFYIMITYCLAQFLIIFGAVKFIREKQQVNH